MNSFYNKTPLQQYFVVQMGSQYMAIDQQSGGYPYGTTLDRAKRFSTLEKAIEASGISNDINSIIHCKVYGEAVMPEEIKNQLRQSAIAKLTQDELRALGLFWSDEDGTMILAPCDEPPQEQDMAYFYIQVETDSEYKHIRMDMWNTPVRTNDHSKCTHFATYEEALDIIKRFDLVRTAFVHKIRLARVTGTYMWDDIVYAHCSLKNFGNGKFGLAVSKRM